MQTLHRLRRFRGCRDIPGRLKQMLYRDKPGPTIEQQRKLEEERGEMPA